MGMGSCADKSFESFDDLRVGGSWHKRHQADGIDMNSDPKQSTETVTYHNLMLGIKEVCGITSKEVCRRKPFMRIKKC